MRARCINEGLPAGPTDFSSLSEMVDFLERKAGFEFDVSYDFDDLVPLRGKVFRMVKRARPPLVEAIFQK